MSRTADQPAWDWSAADLAALAQFLAARDLVHGPLTARPVGDGHSNLTFVVTGQASGDAVNRAADGATGHVTDGAAGQATDGAADRVAGAPRTVVVRRPPPPPRPAGANDVLREARWMAGLAGTSVPVPAVLATAAAGEVLECPLVVMSHVRGPVVTTRTPEPFAGSEQRAAIGASLVDTLAALHAVDWRAAGLADLGKPEGFNARHLRRMRHLLPDLPPAFLPVGDWLEAHVPVESGATILHNDFRLGNVILAPDRPGRVAAVLDWELATLGDPLLDVGYLLASWPEPDEPLVPTAALGTVALEPGWPRRAELARRYAQASGRDVGDLRWHTTMALWKLAVLYEYSRRRATDPYYADPALVAAFLAAADAATIGARHG